MAPVHAAARPVSVAPPASWLRARTPSRLSKKKQGASWATKKKEEGKQENTFSLHRGVSTRPFLSLGRAASSGSGPRGGGPPTPDPPRSSMDRGSPPGPHPAPPSPPPPWRGEHLTPAPGGEMTIATVLMPHPMVVVKVEAEAEVAERKKQQLGKVLLFRPGELHLPQEQ